MSSILHKEQECGKAYEHEIGGHVTDGRKQIQKSGSTWIKLYCVRPHEVIQLWSQCDYSNWGTWIKIIQSHWFLKTKDSQVFFFSQQTNNIHEFEGCFLKAQVSSNGFKVFNSCIVEPWILLVRLQKYLRIFYFQKTLWLDTLLPSAPVWVVKL